MGFQKQWWKTASESPLCTMQGPVPDHNVDQVFPGDSPQEGQEEVEEREGSGSDNNEAIEDEDACAGPSCERLSAKTSRAEVKRRRQQCASTMHFVSKVLARDLNVRLWSAMVYLPLLVEIALADMVGAVKTRRGVAFLHEELVHGKLADLCFSLGQRLGSEVMASASGFTKVAPADMSDYQCTQNTVVLRSTWSLFLEYTGQLLMTGLQYRMPPLCFIGLLAHDESMRLKTMENLR